MTTHTVALTTKGNRQITRTFHAGDDAGSWGAAIAEEWMVSTYVLDGEEIEVAELVEDRPANPVYPHDHPEN